MRWTRRQRVGLLGLGCSEAWGLGAVGDILGLLFGSLVDWDWWLRGGSLGVRSNAAVGRIGGGVVGGARL